MKVIDLNLKYFYEGNPSKTVLNLKNIFMKVIFLNLKYFYEDSHHKSKIYFGQTTSTSLVRSGGRPHHKVKSFYKDDLSKSDLYFMKVILLKLF